MKYDIRKFGSRIKSRRNELGMQQKELATKLWHIEIFGQGDKDERDIARSIDTYRKRLGSYENNNVYPHDPDIYCRLCEHLDCDMNYLFGGIVYKDGKTVDCLPNPLDETIEEQLYLSPLASAYLRIASGSYINEKINETTANDPEFHNFEIGKKGKFLFLQQLLENPEIWETIGAAYFDHILEIEYAKTTPNDYSSGFSHLDLAEIYTGKAQAALRELFVTRSSTCFEELGIIPQNK